MCPLDHGCCGELECWARQPVNHTCWITVVTPTYRPKSVRNRCVIELCGDGFVLSCCPVDISVGIRAFCHMTESDLVFFSLIFIYCYLKLTSHTIYPTFMFMNIII